LSQNFSPPLEDTQASIRSTSGIRTQNKEKRQDPEKFHDSNTIVQHSSVLEKNNVDSTQPKIRSNTNSTSHISKNLLLTQTSMNTKKRQDSTFSEKAHDSNTNAQLSSLLEKKNVDSTQTKIRSNNSNANSISHRSKNFLPTQTSKRKDSTLLEKNS